jgi:trigger factor
MTVELEAKQRDKILQKAARRIAKEVQIPGFRPGKAPYGVVVNRFGEAAVQEEATEDLTTTIFQQAIQKAELDPSAPSSLTDVQWEPDLVLKITVPVDPVIELGNYRQTELKYEEPTVSEEEIQAELERLQKEMAVQEPTNSPAKLGDTLNILVVETDPETDEVLQEYDDEIVLAELEENSDEVDWATHLLGLSEGATQEFTHSFVTEAYKEGESDSEEEIQYTVTINAITIEMLDEINDEFASLVGEFDTLDALKANIEATILERKQASFEAELVDTYLQEIIDQAENLKWPPALERVELENGLHQYRHNIERLGISWDMFLRIQNRSSEELLEDIRQSVVEDMKKSLVIGKLGITEKIEIADAEFDAEFNRLVSMENDVEKAIQAYSSPGGIEYIGDSLLTAKVKDRLLAILKGEAPSLEELEAQAAEKAEAEKAEAEKADQADQVVETPAETPLETEQASE